MHAKLPRLAIKKMAKKTKNIPMVDGSKEHRPSVLMKDVPENTCALCKAFDAEERRKKGEKVNT